MFRSGNFTSGGFVSKGHADVHNSIQSPVTFTFLCDFGLEKRYKHTHIYIIYIHTHTHIYTYILYIIY